MAQVTIKRNSNNEIVLIDGDKETVLKSQFDKDGIEWFPLPQNSAEWRSLRLSTLIKHDYEMTLETREPRTITNTTPRKSIREWLSEDDQKLYDELIARAEENKKAAKQPLSKEDKLRAQIAKYQAQLEALKANN